MTQTQNPLDRIDPTDLFAAIVGTAKTHPQHPALVAIRAALTIVDASTQAAQAARPAPAARPMVGDQALRTKDYDPGTFFVADRVSVCRDCGLPIRIGDRGLIRTNAHGTKEWFHASHFE